MLDPRDPNNVELVRLFQNICRLPSGVPFDWDDVLFENKTLGEWWPKISILINEHIVHTIPTPCVIIPPNPTSIPQPPMYLIPRLPSEGALRVWMRSPKHNAFLFSRSNTIMGIGQDGGMWTFRALAESREVTKTRVVAREVTRTSPTSQTVCTTGTCPTVPRQSTVTRTYTPPSQTVTSSDTCEMSQVQNVRSNGSSCFPILRALFRCCR